MIEFQQQWALILGGSSGLGLASAKKLASEGMNICIVHRDRRSNIPEFEKEVEQLKNLDVSVKTFNQDALNSEIRNEIISELPKNSIKLLLHSIAKGSLKPMHSADEAVLQKQDLDITLHAMATSWYEWTQALVQSEKFSKKAKNIAFTSEGSSKVWPGYAAVSAAKSTLESLMRSMAVELAPINITTNCIQAGTTKTASFAMIPGSEELAAMSKNETLSTVLRNRNMLPMWFIYSVVQKQIGLMETL